MTTTEVKDKRVLLVVDLQYDFLPGGSLGVEGGSEALQNILKIAKLGQNKYSLFLASCDWHPADHISFSDQPKYRDFSWPPHCVQYTRGAEIHHDILKEIRPIIVTKGQKQAFETYSAFDGFLTSSYKEYTLHDFLRRKAINAVDIVGLATDYCVKATALDAVRLGYNTTVLTEGIAAVDKKTGANAIKDMQAAGANID